MQVSVNRDIGQLEQLSITHHHTEIMIIIDTVDVYNNYILTISTHLFH